MEKIRERMKKILVVDDEPINIRIVEHILKKEEDCVAYSALDGEQALKVLEEKPMDLILLDVKMPGMDGFETFEHIRSICDTPILFITADDDQDMQQRVRTVGAQGCLIKPFAPELLRESVHRYVHC